MATKRACAARCGASFEVDPRGRGPARKWCSESCRQWAFRNPGAARPRDTRPRSDLRALGDFHAVLLADPCVYCGEPSEHIDHITPRAKGGQGDWMNLASVCGSCNGKKGTKSLLAFLGWQQAATVFDGWCAFAGNRVDPDRRMRNMDRALA